MSAAPLRLAAVALAIVAATGTRAAEAPLRVPIRVSLAQGLPASAGDPVTTGIPFAEGALHDPSGLRLETASGTPLPAQFSVRARHPAGGDVRWLGVDFPLADGTDYVLVAGRGAAPVPAQAVRVEETSDHIAVTTGPLRAEIPRTGGMLDRVWHRGRLEIDGRGRDGNWLVRLADGRRFSDRRDPETAARVELAGPLHAVVRVDGRYADAEGRPSCRWTARLHFYAGRSEIRITHTFTWIGSAEELQIRELAVGFPLARRATRAAADREAAPGDAAVERPLADGEILSLLQDRHWHFGHGESHFAVRHGPAGSPAEIATGDRAGSWVDASDDRGGVALVLRDLWQSFPKELRATDDALVAYLWASAGASEPLDLRLPALERFWGPLFTARLRSPRFAGSYARFAAPPMHDPTGMARTHDLMLVFHDGGWRDGGVAARADAFERPPLAIPDPRWTFASGEVDLLGPLDRERFPELESNISRAFDDVQALVEDWGDYGFLYQGSGPHHAYEIQDGRAVATPWRFTGGQEYGYARALWLAWLRSGDRRYFDLASSRTRFLNDVVMSHEDSRSRVRGDWYWHASGASVLPWAGAHPPLLPGQAAGTSAQSQGAGFTIEHALFHYYLTGDERSLDAVRDYAHGLRYAIEHTPGWPQRVVAGMNTNHSRILFQKLEELGVLYEQFDDPWAHARSRELADALLDLDDPSGIHREPGPGAKKRNAYPAYIFYKAPNLIRYARAVEGREREKAHEAIVRMAQYELRTLGNEVRSLGLRMSAAWALSADARYLSFARTRLLGRREAEMTDPQGRRGYVIRLAGVPGRAADAILGEAYLAGGLRRAPSPLPRVPLSWKSAGLPRADLVLLKEAARSLTLEIVSGDAHFTTPDGEPWPTSWLGRATRYATPGGGRLEHRRAVVPAGAAAGEYRVRLDRDGAATLLASDATSYALIATDGIDLGRRGDDPWYFRVPEGTAALRLGAAAPDAIELRDPAGSLARARPDGAGAMRVERPSSGIWSARALAPTFLAVGGAEPVFAYGVPERLAGISAASASAEASREDALRSGFATGHVGRGLRLCGSDVLSVPVRGRLTSALAGDEGTVELWFQPDWDAALLPLDTAKGVLRLMGGSDRFEALYRHGLGSRRDPIWDLRVRVRGKSRPKFSFPVSRGPHMRWERGRWVHLALSWYRDGGQPTWLFAVDGRAAVNWPKMSLAPLPHPITSLRVASAIPESRASSLDGVIDQLRISSVARYRVKDRERTLAFDPPREMAADADTLLLFDFEGDVVGRGAAGPRSAEPATWTQRPCAEPATSER